MKTSGIRVMIIKMMMTDANAIQTNNFSVKTQSKLQAVKKPLIALLALVILFSWSLYLAIGMEAGKEYDVTGQHYNSIPGIVLALASLGVKNLCLIFGSLILIAGVSFIQKYKNPVIKSTISVKH